jgi:mono/diheme cytochrome c family protein
MRDSLTPRGRYALMLALLVLIWFASMAVFARPQTTGSTLPPLMITSVDGRDLFQFYCASCHGKTGRGDGPVAPALKQLPTDLTLLAGRAGGATSPAAHGSSEMPVWGPIFRALDPNDRRTSVRIDNLVRFLESIQVK